MVNQDLTLSLLFYQISSSILQSYQQSLFSLLHALKLQESFHYMEPEVFYLPLMDCYLPLLQEIQIFLLFLNDLSLHILNNRENQMNQTISQFNQLLSKLTKFMGNLDFEKLYDEERKKRYSQNDSVWYRKGRERYEMIKQRRLGYEVGSMKNPNESENSKNNNNLKLLINWFITEKNQDRILRNSQNNSDYHNTNISGSCCELQYC